MKYNLNQEGVARGWRNDSSAWVLILINLITIVWAVAGKWELSTIIWIYWCQSVIIGLFQAKKILDLKKFSTKDFKFNNRPVLPTENTKRKTALFFVAHYGLFHVVYFIFLSLAASRVIWSSVFLASGIFLANHLFSYFYNRKKDREKVQNIGRVMFFPYARIIPMHFIILFGFFLVSGPVSLVFFLGFKTIADLVMHVYEHKL